MTLTERLVNAMPPVDIMEVFDKLELYSTKFLFFYCPILACALIAIKGLEFVYRGIRLLRMAKNGRYFRGKVVGKHRENGEFFNTGRLFFLTYPVVQYKRCGKLHTCIANKAKKTKIGDVLSVYVCPDGDEHLPTPGILTVIYGLALILIGAIGTTCMYSFLNIFV